MTFDSIIADMSDGAIDWLASALGEAASREEDGYIDAFYKDRQAEVVRALEKLARLTDSAYMERV